MTTQMRRFSSGRTKYRWFTRACIGLCWLLVFILSGSGSSGASNWSMATDPGGQQRLVRSSALLDAASPSTLLAAGDEKWNGMVSSPGVDDSVYAMALEGSNVYVGGDFTEAGGVPASRVAKWNGSYWLPLGSGLDGSVFAMVVDGSGNIYVGGSFTHAGGVSAPYIAKWDGSTWSALGNGLSGGPVYALAVDGAGNVYAGGAFTMAGGLTVNRVAMWNGYAWSALGSGTSDVVSAVAVDGSNVYVGGMFTHAGGLSVNYIAWWNGSFWSSMGSGMNSNVYAIAVDGSDVYAGGAFTQAGGLLVNNIARWNGTSWSSLGTGVNDNVSVLVADVWGGLYAGGDFILAGSTTAHRVANWNGSSWFSLGSNLNGSVGAIAADGNGNVYVGGDFTRAGPLLVNHIAMWNGRFWSSLGGGLNGTVRAIAIDGNNVYVGGYFSEAGGVPANKIARWDVSSGSWSALGSGASGVVYAIAIEYPNSVYVGGEFTVTTAYGSTVSNLAKWRTDYSDWFSAGFSLQETVTSIAVSGSAVYVGGWFTPDTEGWPAKRIIWIQGSNYGQVGPGLNNAVLALAAAPGTWGGGQVYAGGMFTATGAPDYLFVNHIGRSDAYNWFALGSGMDSGVGDDVIAIAVDKNSHVYVGGRFTTAAGESVPANHVARWNGSSWSSLGSGTTDDVYDIATSGNDVYVGGRFTTAGGKPSYYFAHWDNQPADVDNDGDVDIADIQAVANLWRQPAQYDPRCDLVRDSIINIADVMYVASQM